MLLSNRYAENVKQEMADEVRGMITDMDLRPNKPYTWTELGNKIHAFGTGNVAHRRSQRIYLELQCLMQKMEGKGQRPESDFSFRDVDEERECWPFLLASSVHNPGVSQVPRFCKNYVPHGRKRNRTQGPKIVSLVLRMVTVMR